MTAETSPAGARVGAIDVLRGLTLALMIVVNMSIGEAQAYAPLLHAAWHGLTLTDLVFPSFLFAVGASMAFTMDRQLARGTGPFLARVARRAALIFLCGFLLYGFPFFRFDATGALELRPLSEARIPGVLQRIALCYAAAALVVWAGGVRGALWACAIALLGGWGLTVAFGDLTLQGNAALRLDRWLLGEAHLYKGEGIPFDPEGVLGTLPATANVLAGWLAAHLLRTRGTDWAVVGRLLLAGCAAVAVGWLWSDVLPLNKKLWTPSYALLSAGVATVGLAALVAALPPMQPRQPRWAGFFVPFGRNTLFIYLLAELGMATLWLTSVAGVPTMRWVYDQAFAPWLGAKPGGLAWALVYMLGCAAVARALDRRGLYIRL